MTTNDNTKRTTTISTYEIVDDYAPMNSRTNPHTHAFELLYVAISTLFLCL